MTKVMVADIPSVMRDPKKMKTKGTFNLDSIVLVIPLTYEEILSFLFLA
jgi:hypothetical protein